MLGFRISSCVHIESSFNLQTALYNWVNIISHRYVFTLKISKVLCWLDILYFDCFFLLKQCTFKMKYATRSVNFYECFCVCVFSFERRGG